MNKIEKLRELIGDVYGREPMQLYGHTIINDHAKFVDTNYKLTLMNNGEPSFIRLRDYYYAAQGLSRMPRKTRMSSKDMVVYINELLEYHRIGIILESEYTAEIYDFLESEGKLILTDEEKKTIFADAINKLIKEMQPEELSPITNIAKDAERAIGELKMGIVTPQQKTKLKRYSKELAVKQYFDNYDKEKIFE